jgi:hypothetical protein
MTPEIRHLFTTLDAWYSELDFLLRCDHPPPNVSELIAQKRRDIEEIEFLICDLKAEYAAASLEEQRHSETETIHVCKKIKI